MSVRVYNLAELKADLYDRIPGDGEHELLMGNSSIGDMTPTLFKYDASSSATDDFPRVIKPTLQSGNGRWLRHNSYYFVLTGTLSMYAGASAPVGYLICDGSAVSRTTYSDLFAITSTVYGTGDGSTTFNLPDLRQRFPMGVAASGTGNALAATGGSIDHTHTIAHTHQVDPPNTTSSAPSATVAATNLTGSAASTTHTHDVNIAEFTSGASSAANSGSANPPFIAVNFIIKT